VLNRRKQVVASLTAYAQNEKTNLALLQNRLNSDLKKIDSLTKKPIELFTWTDECRNMLDQVCERYNAHGQTVTAQVEMLNTTTFPNGSIAKLSSIPVSVWGKSISVNGKSKIESTILSDVQSKNQVLEWLGGKELRLLYRGSRDGFEAFKFHEFCDNKGATLTVIRSTSNHAFGGYASQSWNSKVEYTKAVGSWLFTLTHNGPAMVKAKPGDIRHMGHYFYYGPIFGSGHDLSVYDGCNSNTESYADGDKSYDIQGRDPRTYLCGSGKFQVSEIEVFQVIS
jgi:hypothetical protein